MTDRKHANIALFVPHAGCPHDCSFCNQRTIAGAARPLTPDEVAATLEAASRTLPADRAAQIAFFGGSFTAISRDTMVALLEAAQPFLQSGRFDGIRVSTRPDAIDGERLSLLRRYGVTAIELGAQSMDDRVLKACGRGHTAADTVCAAKAIREGGFALGLQMMTGLPADTDEGARETARQLAALRPDTVRIYPTVVLCNTALEAQWRQGTYTPATLDETVALCAELLYYFEQICGIPVIRLGLHDGDTLREEVLAGGYHPALRELCEGQLYVNTALSVLTHSGPPSETALWTLHVHPKAVSKMIGQRQSNLRRLAQHGFRVRVTADPAVPLWDVRAEKG